MRFHVKPSLIICSVFLLLNIVIFIKALSSPVHWQQGEISFYHFYWSAISDQGQDFILESGLRLTDFLKLAHSELTDGGFRTRHFSNLVELLSLKVWQALEIISFLDITLILLHIINVLLLGILTKYLTRSSTAGMTAMILLLNAGIALNTLMFPFRNAKLLVVTLVLVMWVYSLAKDTFQRKEMGGTWLFFIVFFLALFTDESAVFLIPLMILGLFQHGILNRANWLTFFRRVVITLMMFLISVILLISANALLGVNVSLEMARQELDVITANWSLSAFHDVGRAFWSNLLTMNLGGGGLAGLIGICLLSGAILVRRPAKKDLLLPAIILGMILLKGLLMPYLYGYTSAMMPPKPVYPTLLWFNFYATYPDTVLLCLILGLLLAKPLSDKRWIIPVLTLVTLINILNLQNVPSMLTKPMALHGYFTTSPTVIPKILTLEQIRQKFAANGPIYLSFPSGSKSLFSRTLAGDSIWNNDSIGQQQGLSPFFVNYATILPVKFLRPLERGDLLMSLNNSGRPFPEGNILSQSRFFYDIEQANLLDLELITGLYGLKSFAAPQTIHLSKTWPLDFAAGQANYRIVLFVKKAARISLHCANGDIHARQRYGYSFQLFEFHPGNLPMDLGPPTAISVEPIHEETSPEVFGPFIIP